MAKKPTETKAPPKEDPKDKGKDEAPKKDKWVGRFASELIIKDFTNEQVLEKVHEEAERRGETVNTKVASINWYRNKLRKESGRHGLEYDPAKVMTAREAKNKHNPPVDKNSKKGKEDKDKEPDPLG